MKKRYAYILLIMLFSFAALFVPYRSALVFQFEKSDKVLAFLPIKKGERFSIMYTHSIHLSKVVETYKLKDTGEIQQVELVYEDFGIGMPENAGEGETFTKKDGKYYIGNMNRVFPQIDLRIGKVRANHTLLYKNHSFPLKDSIEPGTWVRIKWKQLTLWQQLRGVNILGRK
ncbi:DUF1850 domain-containing protein [Bacillus sp. M6-12]|nr:DUF1850 domain-containing protein [Bacillus sp. M6-12]